MRSVAVKVFRLDITPEQAAELAAQLGMLARVNLAHPSIVVPFEAGLEGSVAYLSEDYIAADSLDAAIRQYGPAPAGQAVRILAAVAGALDFAAAVGVHHGALHPRDLLVTPDDTRVTGLGVGRALEAIGLRAPMRRPYVAPERAQREAWDARADVYSLGVLARELLVGRSRSDTDAEGRLPDDHAERLKPLLARATAARPADRFSTCLEFIAALQDSIAGAHPAGSRAAGKVESAPARAARKPGEPVHDLLLPLETEEGEGVEGAGASGGARLRLDEPAFIPDLPPPADRPAEPAAAVAPLPDLDLQSAERSQEPSVEGFDLSELDSQLSEENRSSGERFADEEAAGRSPVAGSVDASSDEVEGEDLTGGIAAGAQHLGPDGEEPAEEFAGAFERQDGRIEVPAGLPVPGFPPASSRRRPRPVVLAALVVMFGAAIVLGAVGGYFVGKRQSAARGASSAAPAQPVASPASSNTGAPVSAAATSGATSPALAARGGLPAPGTSKPPSVRSAPPPAAAAAVRGTLLVRSTPKGASVSVNGRARGVTPARIRNLAAGRYTVRVSRRGYATEERQVTISADRMSPTLTFSLDRAAAPQPASRTEFIGALSVESLPAGARVFVDGRLVGITPLSDARIAAGSHVLRVDRTGFLPWTTPIEIVTGQTKRVTASLERESK